MLYAVGEIAVFMIGATIVGFLLGRITKRSGPKILSGKDTADLASAQASIRELESERASLRGQLIDAKERVRALAAEPTAAESSEENQALADKNAKLEVALDEAEKRADRLRETIAARDLRIHELTSGETPAGAPERPAAVGYSSSAGTLADMKIVFDDDNEG
jgi:seryl-tRNA synthetase